MDAIITPAVIAAVVSLTGVFGKEIWFDRKNNQRQTRILAIKLHYILSQYSLDCANQLDATKTYLGSMQWDEQHGCNCSMYGSYNIKLVDLPLNIEAVDWVTMDIQIVSSITKLALDINIYRAYMNYLCDMCDDDEVDDAYIEKAAQIGSDTLSILQILSNKYNIPYTEVKLGGILYKLFF